MLFCGNPTTCFLLLVTVHQFFYSLGKTSRAPDIVWNILGLKPYLPREYFAVRAIKSSLALAHLSLEKESTMKYFLLEIVMLARSFWTRLYGHLQVFNCNMRALGSKPRILGGCYCGVNSAWPVEESPWTRGRALLLIRLFPCSKPWASIEWQLATLAKSTFVSGPGAGPPFTCMQLAKDEPGKQGIKWKDCSAGFTALSEYTLLLWATEGCLEHLSGSNLLI